MITKSSCRWCFTFSFFPIVYTSPNVFKTLENINKVENLLLIEDIFARWVREKQDHLWRHWNVICVFHVWYQQFSACWMLIYVNELLSHWLNFIKFMRLKIKKINRHRQLFLILRKYSSIIHFLKFVCTFNFSTLTLVNWK